MQEKLEEKRKEIKAKFEQVSSQITQLQDIQKELKGSYSVLTEIIEDNKTEEK